MKVNMENLLEEFGCAGVGGEGLDSEVFCFCLCLFLLVLNMEKDMSYLKADVVEARKDSW